MNKKGNPKRRKKRLVQPRSKILTRKYGRIPKKRHFCILCKLIDGIINIKELTVHHHVKKENGGSNKLSNLEVLCDSHHRRLHHPYFYKKVRAVYKEYRKAKLNKIGNPSK